MKKIAKAVKHFFTHDFDPLLWGMALVFLASLTSLEYVFHIRKELVEAYFDAPYYFFINVLFYGSPFLVAYVLTAWRRKKWQLFSRRFWLLFAVAVGSYALRSSFHAYRDVVTHYAAPENQYYWIRIFNYLLPGLITFFIPYLYWRVYDRDTGSIYGFTLKGFDVRPYLFLLLFMVPLVAIASTQNDFLRYYPRLFRVSSLDYSTTAGWIKALFFELCYGYDFIFVEFFFRGFLVMGFVRVAGKDAILPMAVFYVTIHYGKPLGETISSFFGGTILAIIALETRSIFGGILTHIGVAWLMELGGMLGRNYLQ